MSEEKLGGGDIGSRTCANCACSFIAKHPTLVNKTQMLCRLNPPILMSEQVRTDKGMMQSYALTYGPTQAELTCWKWKPEGTLPGENPNTKRLLPLIKDLIVQTGVQGVDWTLLDSLALD
ncbi:MAG: hypothetical protein ACREQ5_02905 [Candidatus Dormibacteria bacterium]